MPAAIVIDRPDVVALIEQAAREFTGGDTNEVVARAMELLLDRHARSGSLFGAHPGSVRVRDGVDLTAPAFDH